MPSPEQILPVGAKSRLLPSPLGNRTCALLCVCAWRDPFVVWVVARVSNSSKMPLGAHMQGWEGQQEAWSSVPGHVGITRGALKIHGTPKGGTRQGLRGGREGCGDKIASPGVLVVMEVFSIPAVVNAAYTCDTTVQKSHTQVQVKWEM